MAYKNLLYERDDNLGIITINRPDVLNALNIEVYRELYDLFQAIEDDANVRVVILTGSGEKAFVGGADISYMKDKTSVEIEDFVITARRAGDRIYTLSKPVIAAVNGYALGGGWELAMACDIILASNNARFGHPEITLGIVPGGGGMQRLLRVAGIYKAKELIYTGDIIDADTALSIGMVNKIVPRENIMAEARALAEKLLSRSSVALYYAKKTINSGVGMSLTSALDSDENFFARCFATEDQKEGMQAFLEKRKPIFKNK